MVLDELLDHQGLSEGVPQKRPRVDLKPLFNCKIALTKPEARIPTYGSAKAAGMDLYSSEEVTIPPRGKCLVSTGIKMEFPEKHYGWVAPRSGLAVKNGVHVGAGVVDEDYRGEIKVCLYNFSDIEFKVNIGDRIAQQVLIRYTQNGNPDAENEEENLTLINLISANAKMPTAKPDTPAFTLYSSEDVVVSPRGQALVGTDVRMEIPKGYYVRIAGLYNLASECQIQTGAGVIDEDYRGELKICLFNHSDQVFKVNLGDAVAQFILEEYAQAEFTEVPEQDLTITERGSGGFGSTGVEKGKFVYGSPQAAGLDLASSKDATVPAKGSAVIPVTFFSKFPTGYYGRICPRSGLAVKNFIDVGAGVLQSSEKEVNVVLFNHGDDVFKVNVGDRIAQLVMVKTIATSVVKISDKELSQTERGECGFGSTGVSLQN